MVSFWNALLDTSLFMPHGHCYLWRPELVWLNVVSDTAIAVAYFSIPITLIIFIQRRKDLPFSWIFALFGLFIVACGTGHIMDIWTLWHPTYWLSTVVKVFTALVSMSTAIILVPLIPMALALPSPETLRLANQQLEAEVNERKRTEAALQDSLANAQGLNAILDNLADGLLVADTNGNIIRLNLALVKMYQLPEPSGSGEMPMPSCHMLPEKLIELLHQAQQQLGAVTTAEVELAHGRVGQAVARAIFKQASEQTTCLGSAVLIRDVTREREIDRMKTDFISTVSHELRTPLTSILGFASIIKERLEEDMLLSWQAGNQKLTKVLNKIRANSTIIVSEAERLTSLINDLLDVAKMESGEVTWNLVPVNPLDMLHQAIAATEPLFMDSGLEFQLDIPSQLPTVEVDRDRIVQVIINLLSNAVKFTPKGIVRCAAKVDNEYLCISVSDTGIGIAPEDQDKVFDKFKQVGNVLTNKPKGTGLGLSICYQIIKHHGGQIWVNSVVGKGSTFSFTLPLAQRQLATPVSQIPQAQPENTIAPLTTTCSSGQSVSPTVMMPISTQKAQKTILVVDDDPNICELLKQQLETQGYNVLTTGSSVQAIQQVALEKPDLIIMDVILPQISGFDVAAVLRYNPSTAGIPIIILSMIDDRERGRQLGIERYFTKPVNADELLRDISVLLAQGRSLCRGIVVCTPSMPA
ncbi:MAG: ATP-binding protein [Cyanobacteria bacterium]|nr:ATP-binding protein [Cyanobacteriota bacterium]MDW8202366.1 ATP-binding protein [Cyanobacteriota bacterium SKYGB_h_bin112]